MSDLVPAYLGGTAALATDPSLSGFVIRLPDGHAGAGRQLTDLV